ncbi:Multidrug resistance protein 3 [Methylobacterium crusticola]|uniref:MFS-type drug efflux transporter P55 n=1 Tax=Methylobacterium crusticola TaxID=1697972 RepID=A0ABQ4QVX6_9HYPH|nr:MDR family MFS transporter [Methylobacterium crusticola]GJD49515.1 Multidrug resistance protein 3 [Methylobacterium crusticola]
MPTPRTTRRPLVIAAVMAAMAMVAIEATIISTAMPQIVGDLGGLPLYAWVFSGFLLTQTAATIVFGKLADVYGRKPVLLAGIGLFLAASLLCGLAWSMPAMIAFRLLQGIGAGAIQPVSLTIVGDLYSVQERGRIQGFLASVWAVSAVVGPMAGGLIIQHASWSWIFWINLPVGLVASGLFVAYLHEDVRRERRPIDAPGAALFTVAVAALMVALTEAGRAGWTTSLIAAGLGAVAVGLLVVQERRAPEPLIAFSLWSQRPIAAANGTSLLAGMALIGLTTFLPMFVQGVLRQSPVVAGLALTVMVLGWPIGATLAARSVMRFGLRPILVCGSLLLPVGAVAFVVLGPDSPPALAGAGSLVMGFGMGLLSNAALMLIQEIVPWTQRGSATASNVFSRNLGSTLGATLFGAVLNHGLSSAGGGPAITAERLQQVLASGGAPGEVAGVRLVLQHALHQTFWAVFLISLAAVAVASLVPHVPLGRTREAPAE